MADSAHLEKMGRELKCPICLSLLNAAVSLTCNHVFCNLCISESMKSVSNCPVCKVPFRRREVRAAPHMDSLVSIYKSMEAASGINIFVTQAAPSTKRSDGQPQSDVGGITCEAENAKPQQRQSKKRKAMKELNKQDETISKSGPPAKPSFPAKKRVQVPLDPLSETPMRPEKVSKLKDEAAENLVERGCSETVAKGSEKDSSFVLKDKPTFNEQGDPVFKPFFWLREADDDAIEDPSQQGAGDHLTCTPYDAPTFSDIKDSNEGSPIKMTPTVEVNCESKAGDIIDSEMFEWTQRACSPELCAAPAKKKAAEKCELHGIHEDNKVATEIDITCADSPNAEHGKTDMDREMLMVTFQKEKSKKAKSSRTKTSRKRKKPFGKVKPKDVAASRIKAASAPAVALGEVPTGCGGKPGNLNQENENTKNVNTQNKGREYGKDSKKLSHRHKRKYATSQANETAACEVLEACKESCKGSMKEIRQATTGCQIDNGKTLHVGARSMKKCAQRSTKQNFSTTPEVLKDVSGNHLEQKQNQNHDNMITALSLSSNCENGDGKPPDMVKKTRKKVKKVDAIIEIDHDRKPEEEEREGSTLEVNKRDKINVGNKNEIENHSIKKHQGNKIEDGNKTNVKALSEGKVNVLKKCKSISSQVCCAFCQSSSDSEVSGNMAHYFKGKLVAADYNGGSHVIHSHKNCAEWAPNVFFEDDTAFNLEAELTRSRRIKCSCCGIKGAALGCYEKSCRRSFHVPCAKSTPECRWDEENFVMLCPLHASLKLPNETGTQKERKKRESQTNVVMSQSLKTSRLGKWPSGSGSKWVICCSALSAGEKEMVLKFAKLAGASVSKTWSSAVTHVIASTDENGACKRTIKFLMGILEGKWILSIDWIKVCMTEMEPVNEEKYEIRMDVHGVKDGAKRGRQRVVNEEPKLFSSFEFYFNGEFAQSYKGHLQDLVAAGGGIILQRKPISRGQQRLVNESTSSTTLIVYSLEPPEKCDSSNSDMAISCRRAEAHALANVVRAKVVGHSWILDSIAASKLQRLD